MVDLCIASSSKTLPPSPRSHLHVHCFAANLETSADGLAVGLGHVCAYVAMCRCKCGCACVSERQHNWRGEGAPFE